MEVKRPRFSGNNSARTGTIWRVLVVLAALLALVVAGLLATDTVERSTVYTIPNVPYVGKQAHVGEMGYARTDADAMLFALLEYWEPGRHDLQEVAAYFNLGRPIVSVDYAGYIADVAQELEFQEVELDVRDLDQYVNADDRTPLLFFLPVIANQPQEIIYYPATLLIGVDEENEVVVVHDYWLGPNYEITFEEFERRQQRLPEPLRNKYMVVRPADGNVADVVRARQPRAPLERGTVLREVEEMMRLIALGTGAEYIEDGNLTKAYAERVIEHPNFETYLPSYFKTLALYKVAHVLSYNGDVESARSFVDRAIATNRDFDEPFMDWPGYEVRENGTEFIDRISGPYRVLGDILATQGDLEGAREAYREALRIKPTNPFVPREVLEDATAN